MNTFTHATESHSELIGHIGWKYYNNIKKKAMEQEFSMSGLLVSLSIAFFIVIGTALFLSFLLQSIEGSKMNNNMINYQIYKLELSNTENSQNYINIEIFSENELVLKRNSDLV